MTTEARPRRPIVVGADGSLANAGALRWAAAEAADLDADLLLVCAVSAEAAGIPELLPELTAAARSSLKRDQQVVARKYPQVTTNAEVVVGRAQPALVARASDAELVVVGRRGRGVFASLLLGSTSMATAGRADGTVVVVSAEWDGSEHGREPVAVAVDADQPDHASLRFAFERCNRLGQTLRVITAWDVPAILTWDGSGITLAWQQLEQETEERLEKVLASYRSEFAEVVVDAVVAQGHPAAAVLEAAAGTELLVLGPRGKGTLGGFRLGSITRAILSHASSPVAVVHPSPGRSPGGVTTSA